MADNADKPTAPAAGTDAPAEPSKSALKKAEKEAKKAAEKAAKAAKQAALPVVGGKKADDIIGITVSKADNFSQWYQEVVLKAELIEYYTEISGFFVMRPATMYIWNVIRKWFTAEIEALGVDETNFPMASLEQWRLFHGPRWTNALCSSCPRSRSRRRRTTSRVLPPNWPG